MNTNAADADMIEMAPDLPDNVLGFPAKGTVTANDYESVIVPAVHAIVSCRGKFRLLYHLGGKIDCSGFETAASWDDAKVGLKHFSDWERIAAYILD